MSNKIKTIIRHIIAVLAFPREMNNFISYAKSIYKAMNGNPNFPNSASKLTALNADTTALDNAEIGFAHQTAHRNHRCERRGKRKSEE